MIGVLNMKPLKESISITLDSDLLKEIKNRAEQDQRSVSQYINLVLTAHIQKNEASAK